MSFKYIYIYYVILLINKFFIFFYKYNTYILYYNKMYNNKYIIPILKYIIYIIHNNI